MVLLEGINLGPLMPAPIELIAGVILFGIILFVVTRFVVPVFEKTYDERTAEIRGGIEKAERAQEEAALALAEYNNQLAHAREEAARIREEAKTQGAAIIAEMKQQAAEESARMLASAKAHIEAEQALAIQQLRNEVGGLALDLAGKIVGESLNDDARAARTVERFIVELEAQNA